MRKRTDKPEEEGEEDIVKEVGKLTEDQGDQGT